MTRYCCLILLVLAISMFLLAGCTSDIEETGGEHAASVEETSDLPNISASTNLEGEILFYPTFDENYKTGSNEMFAFWFDIPVEWKAVDRSEDGSEYCILPDNDKVDIRIYGQLIEGPEDEFYRQLAGKNGEIKFCLQNNWIGRKITISKIVIFYPCDGTSYLILQVDASGTLNGWP